MRILFLSAWHPYPPDNGSKIRIYNLLRELSAHHEITLISLVDPEDAPQKESPLRTVCQRVLTFPRPRLNGASLKSLLGYLRQTPRQLVAAHSPEMSRAVVAELRDSPYDILVASQRRMAPYAANAIGLPKVWEEVETTVIREAALLERSKARRLRRQLTWTKERNYVRRMVNCFDACTVASREEVERLREIAPLAPAPLVVPNGVDLEYYRPNGNSPQADTLVFTGSLTYAANHDAMSFFLREIFPLILSRRPSVRLVVTGRTEGADLSRLPLSDAVQFSGYLPDIRPVVAGAWACIAPLRIGGGTRLKILEAMALGTPVVATEKGAEGLCIQHGADILLAQDAQSFARETIALLASVDLRRKLAVAGRRTVERLYGWKSIGQRLDNLLRDIVMESVQ